MRTYVVPRAWLDVASHASESSAERNRHDLETSATAQHRDSLLGGCSDQRDLGVVADSVDLVGLARVDARQRGVHVASAGEHQRVHHVEELDRVLTREQERAHPGAGKLVDVRLWGAGDRQVAEGSRNDVPVADHTHHRSASSTSHAGIIVRLPYGCQQRALNGRTPRAFPASWGSLPRLVRVIRFDKVTKTYPGQKRPALDALDLEIEKGEFVFLVGASGSGKSTFLRLILRETTPTTGRVYVAGKEINKLSSWKVPKLRRQVGTVFQDFRLLPNKTVSENVAFALQVIGKSRSEIAKVVPETLEMVGLEGKGHRMPDELSGGEQQRVAVARAFVNRPMILIADEPTGNLDPATSVGIMKLLDRINRTDTTVVMATHDSTIVDQMRKRVIELEGGLIVRDEARGIYGYQN